MSFNMDILSTNLSRVKQRELNIGDEVLTHKLRFMPIKSIWKTLHYRGAMIEIVTHSCPSKNKITLDLNKYILKWNKLGYDFVNILNLNIGDDLVFLGRKCMVCGVPIPWKQKVCYSRMCAPSLRKLKEEDSLIQSGLYLISNKIKEINFKKYERHQQHVDLWDIKVDKDKSYITGKGFVIR